MIVCRKHTFKNGLRLITLPLKNTRAVTVFIAFGAGSRYETIKNNGLAHFIEHMFFKGGKKYPSTKAVASALDGVGGEFNAMTADEWVAYYVKVARPHLELAFDVLSDMLLYARFPENDIKRERGVILEEYNLLEDTPMIKIGDLFEELLFGKSSIGLPTIGTPEAIKSFRSRNFVGYKKDLYTPDNMVVSVAGAVSENLTKKLVSRYLDVPATKKALPPSRASFEQSPVKLISKKTEQSHLILGVPAFGVLRNDNSWHPDRYALKVLATILGGGMSSRLFLAVRERKGLAYYVRTLGETYTDTGYLATSAGVDKERVDLAIQTILREHQRIVQRGVKEDELKKAKEFIKGRMILGLEDSNSIAAHFALQEVLYDRSESLKTSLEEINKVKISDVIRLARQLFKPRAWRLAIIGPYQDAEHFIGLLR